MTKKFQIIVGGRIEGIGTAEQIADIALYFMNARIPAKSIEIKEVNA